MAFLLEFVAAVFITGFVAKRLRIEDATYSRALGAPLASYWQVVNPVSS